MTGVIGALFVALARHLGIIPSYSSQGTPNETLPTLLFLGLLAGLSERLVPSLIRKIDSDPNPERTDPQAGEKPVSSDNRPAKLSTPTNLASGSNEGV